MDHVTLKTVEMMLKIQHRNKLHFKIYTVILNCYNISQNYRFTVCLIK